MPGREPLRDGRAAPLPGGRACCGALLAAALAGCGAGGGGPASAGPGAAATPTPAPAATAGEWLRTAGNRIERADGTVWVGRGVNIHDTRSCNACAYQSPDVGEVLRRVDEAVAWGADFLRLDLESYASADGRAHWRGVLDDPDYLAAVQQIVAHVASRPGVYVMVSLWTDPSFDSRGWPTEGTAAVWRRLAEVFRDEPRVVFGVANEPESNFDGALDAQAWQAMNDVVAAIRQVEESAGTPRHLVAVQGTRQWARVLDYYVQRPIAAGGGLDVVYETHVYDPASTFQARFVDPSRTLPVIIGEFGPVDLPGIATMSLDDCSRLMDRAEELGVPYLGWTFHMRCSPNLLVDASGGSCGIGMPLQPTAWGELLRSRLSRR